MTDIGFSDASDRSWIDQAADALTDEKIGAYLAPGWMQARAAGHSDDDIRQHFGMETEPVMVNPSLWAQGERLRIVPDAGSYKITAEQRALADAGKVKEFWVARQAVGDPIARIALLSLAPPGGILDNLFGGAAVNNRLEAFSRASTGHGADFEAVRAELMKAHIAAVDKDVSRVIGLLDPGQVYDYHQRVFARHGLPATTFGGSPFTGERWESYVTRPIWCSRCDR